MLYFQSFRLTSHRLLHSVHKPPPWSLWINKEEIIESETMGLVRDRWRLPFRRSGFHSSSSSSSSSSLLQPPSPHTPSSVSNPPDLPPEFLCPISGALMADPVIIPSGETFERACIEACRDLSVSPPSLSADLSSSLLLIPNSALRSAIIRWCDVAGVPHPLTVSSEVASHLARLLLPAASPNSKSQTQLPNEISSPTASSSSSEQSTSSSSSSETIPAAKPQIPESPIHADPLEEKIMAKLKHAKIQELESALISLLETTRQSASCRVALGSPRLLAVLKDLLHSRHTAVKSTVLAVIVNLSLEPENKVRVVRSGVVPGIVDALRPSSTATEHAAGALFSLALEEQNRTVIGVLGAVPPLLRIFCTAELGFRARLEAGMALHYLCLSEINVTKVARIPGAVKGLISVARADARALSRVAMRLMVGMVESKEGKAAMLDGGAVEAAVAMLRNEEQEEDEEMMLRVLYGMSFGGLRFRGIARRAGAEEALEIAAGRSEGEKREMATMTLRAIRGDAEMEADVARILWAEAVETEEERSGGPSEKLAAGCRIKQDSGSGSGPNSAGF
ncbi:U-box domain-containing protein 39 [Platanthera guangdongensis]|uniref:RING-type E3 ubiquitin transferase n=1 Tax=Platanthera guangdongensis TaxID=2320717 RepID=A0ABR2LXH7_9ASPA